MTVIATLYWILFSLPVIFLHIEYYLANKGMKVEIHFNELAISRKGETIRYSASDLAGITLYKSASLDKGGIPFTGIESYFYLRIVTKAGKKIILTRLLDSNIDKILLDHFKNVPFIRKKILWSSIKYPGKESGFLKEMISNEADHKKPAKESDLS